MPANAKDPPQVTSLELEGDEESTWIGGFAVLDTWEDPPDAGMRQRPTIDLSQEEDTKPFDAPVAEALAEGRWK